MRLKIKDIALAPEGKLKIQWARAHMPVLNLLASEMKQTQIFKGKTIAICLHLEAKTACMALVMKELGADVRITGSNPLSTQDDVAAALAEAGVNVFARYGVTPEEYNDNLHRILDVQPDLIIDDGGDLAAMLHNDYRHYLQKVIGGAEETTTGLHRLRALDREGRLAFPMLAVNDAYCKYLFDNRYGTGQSAWDGIMRTTNLVIAGKAVVIVGFGWCGRGAALRAQGLGARVIVVESDPIRALEAYMEGYRVMPMKEAAPAGDFFLTVTGCCKAIAGEDLEVMKDKAVLANAGHFDVEIDKTALEEMAVSKIRVRRNIDSYTLADGRQLYLLAEGRLVNLAAGDGHPAEIMDLSFALQVLAMKYLVENGSHLSAKVLNLPIELDRRVAELKLEAEGIKWQSLTEQQEKYLSSWNQEAE